MIITHNFHAGSVAKWDRRPACPIWTGVSPIQIHSNCRNGRDARSSGQAGRLSHSTIQVHTVESFLAHDNR